ncbi:LGFP repeat-containing protein [Gordonia aurantiaca]|uniref:LGFP repeat-containing protein n=1 Tax=Gordonia sp. B21 TaxID=3151852 RepID=UPI003262CF26
MSRVTSSLRRSAPSFAGRTRVRLTTLGVAVVAMTLSLLVIAPNAHADRFINGYIVGGKIEEAYAASGGFWKWGAPTGPERPAARGGRYQTFTKDASFYWHWAVDGGTAHQVGGAIRYKWQRAGAERSALGYPTSDEYKQGSARLNDFQGGVVAWSKRGGAQIVWGQILNKWRATGGAKGYYGVPLGGEYRIGNRFAQDFLNGTIFWP